MTIFVNPDWQSWQARRLRWHPEFVYEIAKYLIINTQKKQLQKLDELVKARFAEMFGDPEVNPYGWNQITVKDVCSSIVRGPFGVKKTGLSSFPSGTVILSSRAPIGKVAIAGCEMYCNQGFKNLICSDRINNRYLYWFLKGNTAYLNSLGRGATFKRFS